MPNLLLIGPTNNGKSMIVEKFRRMHPPVSHPDHEHIPVLAVQMPSEPSVIRFYVALLAAMGAPLRPRQRLAELEQVTLALLRTVGVRTLVIDELHNVLAGRGDVRREFLNLIRFLGQTSCASRSPDTHGDRHRPDQPQRRRTRDSRLRQPASIDPQIVTGRQPLRPDRPDGHETPLHRPLPQPSRPPGRSPRPPPPRPALTHTQDRQMLTTRH